MCEEKQKHKSTQFLERNEIWFKTVLSMVVTIAALFVSIASYNTAQYQAQLSAIAAERDNREKQPFFSIDNAFDENRNQYICSIVNTRGEIGDVHVSISPFLYLSQEDAEYELYIPVHDKNAGIRERINVAFIYLPGMYEYEMHDTTNYLFSFSDVWIEDMNINFQEKFGELDKTGSILLSEHLSNEATYYNYAEMETCIHSYMVYYVEISYTNYENSTGQQVFWLDRCADELGKTEGNVILYKDSSLENDYKRALLEGNVQKIDSLNEPLDVITETCVTHIFEYLEKFGQVRPMS